MAKLHTLAELLELVYQHLQKNAFPNAKRKAEDLISLALNCSRMQLYLDLERPIEEAELKICRDYLKRVLQHEPSAYIKGEVQFYSCRIFVDSRVLIPRQETEILVDLIVERLATRDLKNKVLWDLACGSGCIGIALKKRFPGLKLVLSDISSDALDLAKKNAEVNEVQADFLKSDLFENFEDQADIIVSNPPYISGDEFKSLEPSVKDFEPKIALLSGPSGLEFYERFSKELPRRLKSSGLACFEIGASQGSNIKKIFSSQALSEGELAKDWAGHDRFFFLEKQASFS